MGIQFGLFKAGSRDYCDYSIVPVKPSAQGSENFKGIFYTGSSSLYQCAQTKDRFKMLKLKVI